jgi:lysine/ornithine N-monooxygenase
MTTRRIATLSAALALGLGLATPALAAEADIVQRLKTAKTAADHEAIAKHYEAQAADAKKNAELHREMAATYTAGGTSIGKGTTANFPQHCQNLVKTFEEEATHYTQMAQAHRELAKAAK